MIRSKKGFTLVELMVVISIIGVLAAALIAPVTGARRTARAVRCKANLKNLAQAAHSYALDSAGGGKGILRHGNHLPSAGTYERDGGVDDNGRINFVVTLGWVSGYNTVFPWPSLGTPILGKNADNRASYPFFNDNEPAVYQSITNGALWKYVGANLSVYVCDEHKSVAKNAGCKNVLRSYVMNAYFGCNLPNTYASNDAEYPKGREWVCRLENLSTRGSASTLLMFAELPAYNASGNAEVKKSLGESDGILDVQIKGYYTSKPGAEEIIGFNHKTAKRMIAHVAYADGHVDAIMSPEGATLSELRDLTYLLCNGFEVPARKSDWSSARQEF